MAEMPESTDNLLTKEPTRLVFKLDGKEYELSSLTIGVMEELENTFGSWESMGKEMNDHKTASLIKLIPIITEHRYPELTDAMIKRLNFIEMTKLIAQALH